MAMNDITKLIQTAEESNILFILKLTIDRLQPVLINILIRSILNITVSQGSVVRCNGIFINCFVTQS